MAEDNLIAMLKAAYTRKQRWSRLSLTPQLIPKSTVPAIKNDIVIEKGGGMAIHIGMRSSPQQLRRTVHTGIGFSQQPQFISMSILVYTDCMGCAVTYGIHRIHLC